MPKKKARELQAEGEALTGHPGFQAAGLCVITRDDTDDGIFKRTS
jgi:hypothetical protein